MSAFHSTKIPVWNFWNSLCLMERYIWYIFGYCSCKQDTKERNNFVIWKGTFQSDRPKWIDQSKWNTFTTVATTYFCPRGGKLSPPPPRPSLFFQGGIWKIAVNLQSEIFIPKWAVIISDHAGSLALQWITGWNNTIWADRT